MDHIISPEANAAVAEWFGEAPANTKACDLTADKSFCDTFHAERRGVRRPDLVLDHADRAVPRRPHRRRRARTTRSGPRPGPRSRAEPRRRGRQGPSRDPAPGLATGASAPLDRGLHRHPRLRLGLLLGPPMLWLGVGYLGRARGAVRHGAVDRQRVHRRHRTHLDARQLPRALQRSTSTAPSPCAPCSIAVAVTVIDAVIAFPMAFYMAKVASPRAQTPAGHRDPDAAVGDVPRQGVRLARHVRNDGPIDWVLAPFGLASPGYGLFATVVDAGLPVAAVHDPADVRRPGAAARTRCSRRLPTSAPGGA